MHDGRIEPPNRLMNHHMGMLRAMEAPFWGTKCFWPRFLQQFIVHCPNFETVLTRWLHWRDSLFGQSLGFWNRLKKMAHWRFQHETMRGRQHYDDRGCVAMHPWWFFVARSASILVQNSVSSLYRRTSKRRTPHMIIVGSFPQTEKKKNHIHNFAMIASSIYCE